MPPMDTWHEHIRTCEQCCELPKSPCPVGLAILAEMKKRAAETPIGTGPQIVLRRGRVYWEWRYRQDHPSKFRATRVPQSLSPTDAGTLIFDEWCRLTHETAAVILWELNEEERAAGVPGVPSSEIPSGD